MEPGKIMDYARVGVDMPVRPSMAAGDSVSSFMIRCLARGSVNSRDRAGDL